MKRFSLIIGLILVVGQLAKAAGETCSTDFDCRFGLEICQVGVCSSKSGQRRHGDLIDPKGLQAILENRDQADNAQTKE